MDSEKRHFTGYDADTSAVEIFRRIIIRGICNFSSRNPR